MLIIQTGESKSVKMGVSEAQAREKFKSLMDMFTMYPTSVEVFNKTKTCVVTVLMKDNVFHITVTNPQDEVFQL